MPTQAEIARHREAIAGLALLAQADMADLLRALDLEDARRVAAVVREFVPELAAAYTLAASTVAADWYDDLRAEAEVAAAYTSLTLDPPEADVLQSAVGFALAPLFAEEQPAPQDAATRLTGLAETLVTQADRQTVETNTVLDVAGPVYARHASANACAFCRMLATRGAKYVSEQSARQVVLPANRRRGEGRKVGEKYHDNCHCTAVPVWDTSTYEEAPYVAQWRSAYTAATRQLGGAQDTKAILAHMRAAMGTN